MAFINGVQYANNALVASVPGRRARNCDIVITYAPAAGAAQETVLLRVNNSTQLTNAAGCRIGCSGFNAGDRVNAAFSAAMTRSVPPQARAYAIQRLAAGTVSGGPGITIDP